MKRTALFVGIDRYESPEINSLQCAEKDASDLYAFFQYAAEYDEVQRLLSPDSDTIIAETEKLLRNLEVGDGTEQPGTGAAPLYDTKCKYEYSLTAEVTWAFSESDEREA